MTPLISCLIIAGVLAVMAVFVVLLGLGLCRAAAMHDVREDTGDYE